VKHGHHLERRLPLPKILPGFGLFCLVLGTALPATAATTPPAVARAGGGQPALAVGFDARGELRAAVCTREPCSVEGGTLLGLPREVPNAKEKARIAIVGLREQRRVVVVTVPTGRPDRVFEAVVAAPLAGSTPLVLFAGLTGLAEGEDGVRRGGMVVVAGPDANGARSVAIGEQREELTLCGRPAILAPREVDARDLTLKPAKVQRLDAAEREKAPRLVATRATSAPTSAAPLLRAIGASSAVGNPAALTDGDVETTWAENRGGSGRGEFIVMNAPGELPLEGLEITVRPERATPEHGASPREFWVATRKQLFSVTLPEDAWAQPGARYVVRFPAPVADDCFALALDSAFDERPTARVGISELRAQTALGSADIPTLVAALPGGGQKAEGAKVMLRALGQPAFDAVLAAFASLDEGGRRVALEILDSAPCATSVQAYVQALDGPSPGQRIHATDRLPRCGAEAAPLLEPKLRAAKGRAFTALAVQLARIAPAQAVGLFVPLMQEREVERRAALRTAIGQIASYKLAQPSIRQALADPATPEVALIDLLRAVGARAKDFTPESLTALARVSGARRDLRGRYLRLEPLGDLAAASPAARELLQQAVTADADSRVRAAAVRAVRDPRAFQPSLVAALADADVRVRLEAAHALAAAPDGPATPALLKRLDVDRWPAVRALSAAALGAAPASPATDQRLAAALEDDDSFLVRRAAVTALGARNARGHAEAVAARLDDDEERNEVRVAAARALGTLCYQPALGTLTEHARRLADPFAAPEQRNIAYGALGALGDLAPRDLASRLGPLLGKDAPRGARAAAEAAVRNPAPRCRKR
jgi:HEAT repeat protein